MQWAQRAQDSLFPGAAGAAAVTQGAGHNSTQNQWNSTTNLMMMINAKIIVGFQTNHHMQNTCGKTAGSGAAGAGSGAAGAGSGAAGAAAVFLGASQASPQNQWNSTTILLMMTNGMIIAVFKTNHHLQNTCSGRNRRGIHSFRAQRAQQQ